jgi:hypothetical protein
MVCCAGWLVSWCLLMLGCMRVVKGGVRHFLVHSAPPLCGGGGDEMRRKDTEIPPERVFIWHRLILPFRPIGMHISGVFFSDCDYL